MATFERHEGRNIKGIDPDAKDRDLEQYGIWVKAEPQDVFEEPEGDSSSPFVEALEEKSVPNESFLTEEEEKLLGADEESSESPQEVFPGESDIPSLQEEDLSFSIPELGEESLNEPDTFPRFLISRS